MIELARAEIENQKQEKRFCDPCPVMFVDKGEHQGYEEECGYRKIKDIDSIRCIPVAGQGVEDHRA